MAEESEELFQQWTAKRGVALVLRIVKGEPPPKCLCSSNEAQWVKEILASPKKPV